MKSCYQERNVKPRLNLPFVVKNAQQRTSVICSVPLATSWLSQTLLYSHILYLYWNTSQLYIQRKQIKINRSWIPYIETNILYDWLCNHDVCSLLCLMFVMCRWWIACYGRTYKHHNSLTTCHHDNVPHMLFAIFIRAILLSWSAASAKWLVSMAVTQLCPQQWWR